MNPLLMVMNPRQIDECVDSMARLPIDQAWMTGYTEAQLVPVIADIVATTDYSHYLICSDDAVIPEFALEAIVEHLPFHPVVTGYCNLDATDLRVNLTRRPFENTTQSTMDDYDMYHLTDALGWPDELIPTWFAGFAVTGMPRDLWLQYPYRSGGPSDYELCVRLQADDVPIVAPKRALMWHVKEVVNCPDQEPRKKLLVGHIPAEVTWKTLVPA